MTPAMRRAVERGDLATLKAMKDREDEAKTAAKKRRRERKPKAKLKAVDALGLKGQVS